MNTLRIYFELSKVSEVFTITSVNFVLCLSIPFLVAFLWGGGVIHHGPQVVSLTTDPNPPVPLSLKPFQTLKSCYLSLISVCSLKKTCKLFFICPLIILTEKLNVINQCWWWKWKRSQNCVLGKAKIGWKGITTSFWNNPDGLIPSKGQPNYCSFFFHDHVEPRQFHFFVFLLQYFSLNPVLTSSCVQTVVQIVVFFLLGWKF